MLSPHGGERADATGGLDVADDADNHHGRSLNDSDCLSDLLLVGLGTRLLDITHDVGHASLVAHEGSKMRSLGGVITGERLHLTLSALAALLGQEAQMTVAGCLELRRRKQNELDVVINWRLE